jgi:hypothetical protein
VILPPDYDPGRTYPTIAWVYPGYRVRSLNDYYLDPYLAGIYNLQLYAAQGYVVVIPSIPLAGPQRRTTRFPTSAKACSLPWIVWSSSGLRIRTASASWGRASAAMAFIRW